MKKLLMLLTLSAGCAAELTPGDPPDPPVVVPQDDPHITYTDAGRGITESVVDSRDMAKWIYLDLDARKEVQETDPTWDIAFLRFNIKLNGGVSGSGGVDVAIDDTSGIEGVTRASAGPYVTDQADSDDEDTNPDYAFTTANEGWFDYDVMTHILTPKDRVYFVRSTEKKSYKFQILDYYNEARTAGWFKFWWAPVEAGPVLPAGAFIVDAGNDWVYLRMSTGSVVTSTVGTEWDLAINRTRWRTNSGDSGEGVGGARIAPALYDAITGSPTHGFAVDVEAPVVGPAGGVESANAVLNAWYDYDVNTHQLTPKAQSYLVRGARGDYAKLDILAYSEGKTTLRVATVPRMAQVVEVDVDATSPAYLSLRDGAVVAVASSTSAAWDLLFDSVNITTNSGVSGPGQGGAIDPGSVAFDAITGTPSGTVVTDTLLPLPGPPGSGEAPGNVVLGGWYDYDRNTHVVSPKNKAFVIRTADGGWAKIQIVSYASDVYRVRTLYAGAGIDAL